MSLDIPSMVPHQSVTVTRSLRHLSDDLKQKPTLSSCGTSRKTCPVMKDDVRQNLHLVKSTSSKLQLIPNAFFAKSKDGWQKAQNSSSSRIWSRYKDFKRVTQTACREAHANYVQDLISDDKNK